MSGQRPGPADRGGQQPGLWDLPAPDPEDSGPDPDAVPDDDPSGTSDAAGTDGEGLDAGPENGADLDDAQEAVEQEVVERVVARQCAGCENPVPQRATGRPAIWCSHACRQRGYAARAAAARLGRPELAEPRIVREVVERTVTRIITRTVTRTVGPTAEPDPATPRSERDDRPGPDDERLEPQTGPETGLQNDLDPDRRAGRQRSGRRARRRSGRRR